MEPEDSAPLPSLETLKALQRENKAVKEMTTEERLNDIKEQLAVQMLQGRKRSSSSKPSPGTNDLRWRMQQNLNKLNVLATRDAGVKELKRMIEENVTPETLSLLLGNLKEQKKTRTSKAREQEVLLIAHVAFVYKAKLVEEGPTPLRTLTRVYGLVQQYFKDLSRDVHEAAGAALSELYIHCFPKSTPEASSAFILDPLLTIMTTGVDVQMQHAAAYSIYKWCLVLAKRSEKDVLAFITQRIVNLFIKMRPEYPDLISALGVVMDSCGFEGLIPELVNTLAKLVLYVQSKQNNSQVLKLEACKFLKVLPGYLRPLPNLDFEALCQDIVPALLNAKADKQPEVQIAASRALQEWKDLVSIQEQVRKSQEKPEAQASESDPPGSIPFRALTTARAISKVQKEWSGSPDLNFKAHWGVSKPQILEKGSGKYGQIKLGLGKVDFVKALANRPSIRDLVVSRVLTPKQPLPMLSGLMIPRSAPAEPIKSIDQENEQADLSIGKGPSVQPTVRKREEVITPVQREAEDEEEVQEELNLEGVTRFDRPVTRVEETALTPPRSRGKRETLLKVAPGAMVNIQSQKASTPVTSQLTQTSISHFSSTGTQYEEEPLFEDSQQRREMVQGIIVLFEDEVDKVFQDMERSFAAVEQRCEAINGKVDQNFALLGKVRRIRRANRAARKKRQVVTQISMLDAFTQTLCDISVQTSLQSLPPILPTLPPIPTRLPGTDRSVQVTPRSPLDSVTSMWLKCLNLLKIGKLTESYEVVLASGDDLYLLRLLMKTGVCVEDLESDTLISLMERLGLMVTSEFLGEMGSQWEVASAVVMK